MDGDMVYGNTFGEWKATTTSVDPWGATVSNYYHYCVHLTTVFFI